jgi:SHOCT-like domain
MRRWPGSAEEAGVAGDSKEEVLPVRQAGRTTMTAESRKVLEMVAAGKITPEEADRLLDRLTSASPPERAPEEEAAAADGANQGEGRRQPLRFLCVVVDSPGRESIDLRLPLGLVRTGLKLSALMPLKVSQRLSERGIDLSHLGRLDDEALIAELAAGPIEIGAEDGETVRVFCE